MTKAAVKLYSNPDSAMRVNKMFEQNAEGSRLRALVQYAKKYAQEIGFELNLSFPHPIAKN